MQEINKMKQQIQDHLDKVILPFWESLKDDEYGGFYGYMDIDLNVDKKAVKGCILNNRILWFFANAYLNQKRPELLSYAKHALSSCPNSAVKAVPAWSRASAVCWMSRATSCCW